jgi:4a-hydroxytetrahydrobiopterin dehydratase
LALLNDEQIREALDTLEGWEREGDAIVRRYELPSFREAIAFVDRVADRAEAADHHPDIEIQYKKVTLTLSTHSEGGITGKDIDGARSFDEAVS